jgi:hypothetical protein
MTGLFLRFVSVLVTQNAVSYNTIAAKSRAHTASPAKQSKVRDVTTSLAMQYTHHKPRRRQESECTFVTCGGRYEYT